MLIRSQYDPLWKTFASNCLASTINALGFTDLHKIYAKQETLEYKMNEKMQDAKTILIKMLTLIFELLKPIKIKF